MKPPTTAKSPAPVSEAAESWHTAGEIRPTSASMGHDRLDLRPPAMGSFEESGRNEPGEHPRFPLARRPGGSGDDIPESGRIEVAESHARILGRAEAFAQRFHREGLPVARLWENHSALISLGLNQKGKPGLWLVQKTH